MAIFMVFLLISVGPASAAAETHMLYAGVTHSESVPPANTRYPTTQRSKAIPAHKETSATEKLSKEMPASEEHKGVPATEKLSNETPAAEKQKVVPVAVQPVGTLEAPVVEWLQIPRWMAGKWNKKGDQTTSYTDFRTGLTTPMNEWTDDDMTVTWGCQFDREGNIWHAYFIPFQRDARSGEKFVKFVIVSLTREALSPTQVVSRLHSIVTETAGSEVVNMYQQESLNDYFLMPSGQLENNSSNRDFTYDGRPTKEGKLVSLFTKVGPFVPEATHNGIDMLKSLNDYLTLHNMSQLVRTAP